MPDVEKLLKRHRKLADERETFDTLYSEIADFCLPNAQEFDRLYFTGEDRNREIYDQTAQTAIDISSSSLIGLVANPASRWFHIEMTDEELNRNTAVTEWAEKAGQIALNHFNRSESGFYTALKSALQHTLAFGVPAIFLQEIDGYLDFKHVPLSEIAFAESYSGMVDTVFREREYTARQLIQKEENDDWDISPEVRKIAEEDPDKMIKVLTAIMPRDKEEVIEDAIDPKNYPVAGYYIDMQHRQLMHETGYHEHPLPVARWDKVPSEVCGRAPSMIALSDIKTLNACVRMFMFAMEKQIQPAVFLPDDGTVKVVDLSAGAVNPYDASKGRIEFLTGTADLGIVAQFIEQLRDNVRTAFYVDQLQLAAEANMTATEVLQRQDEKARLLAPAIGRIQTELLGPLVHRALLILIRNGTIPEQPPEIQGQEFKVSYVTPINRAQRSSDSQNIVQTVATIGQLAQIDPSILVELDMRKATREILDAHGVSGLLQRDEKEADELLAQQQQQAQQQQLQQLAVDSGAAQAVVQQAVGGGENAQG